MLTFCVNHTLRNIHTNKINSPLFHHHHHSPPASDVPDVYSVFGGLSLELAKLNLRDAAALGLGNRMGATVHDHDTRFGMLGNDENGNAMGEHIFYDSVTAKRTLLGGCCHSDCFFPPVYKITSERIMYVEWDVWHPCDDWFVSCLCWPKYCLSATMRDLCCGMGSGNDENSKAALKRRQENIEMEKKRMICNRWCVIPIGRTANFIDIDLVADVGAHQRLTQLVVNEGDLLLHLLPGDASMNSEKKEGEDFVTFKVKGVPEVFSAFDDLSYDLSLMNLKNYRQNAVSKQMMNR